MGTIQIDGSTPKLTIGNATAEDATILFDGNAQDFHIGLDDTADDLVIGVGSALGTTTALAIDENAGSTFSGTVTVGVDDTGKDVKFFGASAGAYMEWDESADELRIMGASADATTSTGKLLLATSLTDINANDVIGKIDFQAPHEAGGTDAITVAASIRAIAQSTFSSSSNATDLIFYTGHSEAAAEKVRITSQNEIGIAGANYGTDGQVLTSGGAGAAVAWEDGGGAADNYFATSGLSSKDLGAGLHIKTADSSASAASGADELVIENNSSGGLTILSGTSGNGIINFGDSGDNDIGQVYYSHSDNSMHLWTNGAEAIGIDSTGAVTKPLQPCFSGKIGTEQANFAINSWTTMTFDTEIFDLNADYNTGTYTFTAPVTGKYIFSAHLQFNNLDNDSTYWQSQLKTSNREYPMLDSGNQYDANPTNLGVCLSVIADLDAADTAYMRFYQGGGTAEADLRVESYFTGCLLA